MEDEEEEGEEEGSQAESGDEAEGDTHKLAKDGARGREVKDAIVVEDSDDSED